MCAKMRVAPFVALVPCLLFCTLARAEQTAQLSWTRTEGAEACASRAQIERRVELQLGRNPFVREADPGALSFEGVVDRAPNGAFRARLFVADAASLRTPRELVGDAVSCQSLEDATALSIALAIDPLALTPKVEPVVQAPTPRAPEVVVRPASRPERPRSPAHPEGLGGELEGRATMLGNVLPRTSFGAGVEGQLKLGSHASLAVGGQVQPEIRDGDYAFGLSAGTVGGCAGALLGQRIRVEGCGRVLMGGIHAVVYRLEPTEPGQRIWVAAGLGTNVHVQVIGPFGIEGSVFGLGSLVRPRFFVSGTNATVFEVPALGVGATLGLFARL
jgi:hypothetical protein